MATIINQNNLHQITLRSQHIFGRHPATAHTLLSDQSTSRIHATIHWNGSNWYIKDGSSNGTFLNGKNLASGKKHKLTKNDTLQFGSQQGSHWQVIDLSRPKSMLFCIGQHEKAIELKDLNVFPNAQSPEVSIYQNAQAEWVIESSNEQKVLNSGDQVELADEKWIFISPDDIDETRPLQEQQEQSTHLNFAVSSDEEHVDLCIEWNKQKIELGERVHHYLLLCLARQRLLDKSTGIRSEEQGWLEKELLMRMTGMDEKHINIQIYRFRKQLIELQSSYQGNLLALIQRRRGQMRLDCPNIQIKGGHMMN